MRTLFLWILIGFSAVFYFVVSYITDRSESVFLLTQISILYVLLFFIWRELKKNQNLKRSLNTIIWSALGFRILLLFSFPNLSDDVYRFLWDGYITNAGLNPYLFLPENFNDFFAGNDKSDFLLQEMNSRTYFSVYPPLDQLLFATAVFIGKNTLAQVIALKIILLLVELLSIIYLPKLLTKLTINPVISVLYLLNPLVIIEGVGNLHFEVFSVAFLILFFYFIISGNFIKACLTFALSAGIKLLPLLFLPALIRFLGFKKGLILCFVVLLVNALCFIPFFDIAVFENFFSSIDLYFHRFEFNASIYYLIRFIGFYVFGYNIIGFAGTTLALISIGIILILAFRVKTGDFNHLIFTMFLSVFIYFMLSTTIHPWYILTPLILSLFSGFHKSLFFWTYLIFYSYVTYSSSIYEERLWLTFLSYLFFLVAFFFDLKQRRLKHAVEKQN